MKGLLAVLLTFTFGPGLAAQSTRDKKRALKDEEKAMMARNLEVSIKAPPDKIKALIMRAMIDLRFAPGKDSEYQLSFTGEAQGSNSFAYRLGRSMAGSTPEQMLEEIRFVLVPEGGATTVIAQPYWTSQSHRGATTTTADKTRDSHRLLLQVLDQIKAKGEQGQVSAP